MKIVSKRHPDKQLQHPQFVRLVIVDALGMTHILPVHPGDVVTIKEPVEVALDSNVWVKVP